jgi:hypothetical protein
MSTRASSLVLPRSKDLRSAGVLPAGSGHPAPGAGQDARPTAGCMAALQKINAHRLLLSERPNFRNAASFLRYHTQSPSFFGSTTPALVKIAM